MGQSAFPSCIGQGRLELLKMEILNEAQLSKRDRDRIIECHRWDTGKVYK
jgi:hypothetical protein